MRTAPFKYLCLDSGQYGLNVASSDYRDDGVPLLRTSDISETTREAEPPLVEPPTDERFLLRSGDLLLSRSGSVGQAHLVDKAEESSTFAGYLIRFRPNASITDARYAYYLAKSGFFTQAIAADAIVSTIANFNADRYANITVPFPGLERQRRIADFLDNQVGRMDNIISARRGQQELLGDQVLSVAFGLLRGAESQAPRKASGIAWLGPIPGSWPVVSAHSAYEIVLGKMLDEKRNTGRFPVPYLRNTNVQWDLIHIDDLKVMDIEPGEIGRYSVEPGDLLICEGGQPGRSAVWEGGVSPLGFQKALHRARPRGDGDVRWLQLYLRVAVGMNVFANEFGQATISHLTGEQLREARLPLPSAEIQHRLIGEFETRRNEITNLTNALAAMIDRLEELKRSLITAAVSGEFDVSSADGSQVPLGSSTGVSAGTSIHPVEASI